MDPLSLFRKIRKSFKNCNFLRDPSARWINRRKIGQKVPRWKVGDLLRFRSLPYEKQKVEKSLPLLSPHSQKASLFLPWSQQMGFLAPTVCVCGGWGERETKSPCTKKFFFTPATFIFPDWQKVKQHRWPGVFSLLAFGIETTLVDSTDPMWRCSLSLIFPLRKAPQTKLSVRPGHNIQGVAPGHYLPARHKRRWEQLFCVERPLTLLFKKKWQIRYS